MVSDELAVQLLSIVLTALNEPKHRQELIQAFLLGEELIELEELVDLVPELVRLQSLDQSTCLTSAQLVLSFSGESLLWGGK